VAVAITALALLALAGCGSDEGGAAATSTTDQARSGDGGSEALVGSEPPADAPLLGVVNATGGTYDGDALTLTGVTPNGIWFTDRPTRRAGTTPIDDYLPLFFTEDDPPNAAIEVATDDDGADVAVVELTDPEWDAETGELTFTATRIAEPGDDLAVTHPGLADHIARADDTLPTSFGSTALFIDTGARSGEAETPDETAGNVPTTQLTPVAASPPPTWSSSPRTSSPCTTGWSTWPVPSASWWRRTAPAGAAARWTSWRRSSTRRPT
jgi:hypothetical protein